PVSGIVPFIYQKYSTVADHYAYFPMVSVAIGAGLLPIRRAWLAVAVALAVGTVVQQGVWRDDEAFFRHALARNPRSPILLTNHGLVRFQQHRWAEAAEAYRTVAEVV